MRLVRTLLLIAAVAVSAAAPRAISATTTPAAASEATPIDVVGSIGGVTSQLEVSGTLIAVNEGTKLSLIAAADPSRPLRRGAVELPGEIVDLAISGGFAYLALGSAGLHIVDLRDPGQPRLVGRYQPPDVEAVWRVEAGAGIVYTRSASFAGGDYLQAINAGDPAAPVLRGQLSLTHGLYEMQLVGTMIYAVTPSYQRELQIFDVSDPANPTPRGSYNSHGSLFTFHAVGTMIYAQEATDTSSLLLIDARNPDQPVLRGSYRPLDLWWFDVRADGTTVYLFSDSSPTMQAIDAGDPATPKLRGTYTSPNIVGNLQVRDGRAYLLMYGRIMIADLRTLDAPEIQGSLSFTPNIAAFQVVGERLYAIGDEIGLQIFDIGDPARPVLRGAYLGPDPQTRATFSAMYVHDDIAYLTDGDKLTLVDVSDPSSPMRLGQIDGVNIFRSLTAVGNRLYGFGRSSDDLSFVLYMFDIGDPAQPRLLNEYPLPTAYAFDLEVVGNLAYFVGENDWLMICDVGDPKKPVQIGATKLEYTYTGQSLEVAGGVAYVSGTRLQIVDVRDPANPRLHSTYAGARAIGLDLDGTLLAIVDDYRSQLQIVDVRHPFNPRPRATLSASGYPSDVTLTRPLAFGNTYAEGVKIFRVHPDRFPSSIFAPIIGK